MSDIPVAPGLGQCVLHRPAHHRRLQTEVECLARDGSLAPQSAAASHIQGIERRAGNRVVVTTRRTASTKKAGTLDFSVGSGLRWTALELEMVEVGGIEPPSEGTPSPALHA